MHHALQAEALRLKPACHLHACAVIADGDYDAVDLPAARQQRLTPADDGMAKYRRPGLRVVVHNTGHGEPVIALDGIYNYLAVSTGTKHRDFSHEAHPPKVSATLRQPMILVPLRS
ncbi:MAG: hypothetical protein BroJett012_16520 [Betaproteobacteria bacterium]|nr:MAG: hypothetical protein BroJett012_16520 [Betaproteobacteria bacterium]